jgi:hypothetical protein
MDRIRQNNGPDLLEVTAAAFTKFWQSAAAVTLSRQIFHSGNTCRGV